MGLLTASDLFKFLKNCNLGSLACVKAIEIGTTRAPKKHVNHLRQ